ncbi:class 1b ribonucleoside-diphosphate reductase subunit beta [Staphylococcus pseudoxylosus]|uniref:class 1b ribonucleoside-diphosphate reductase subunit beta n=1 Tax=Staphylococcus pseudoxylosus TaxID=2282419 RepID=UPI00398B34C6
MRNLKDQSIINNLEAVDWNTPVDTFTKMFYDQNKNQFWIPEEFSIPLDLPSWNKLTVEERDVYIHVLGGLTLLDTEQTEEGMLHVAKATDHSQRKALLMFMGAMEGIHADSYSTIFQTLASKSDRNELFEWVKGNKNLQYKAKSVVTYYRELEKDDYTYIDLAKAYIASVFLETFLFYSGFYYPLYQYGQGKVMQSGDVINMIIRDESIHGVYIGLLFQELFRDKLNEVEKKAVYDFSIELLEDLYANEVEYTDSVYNKIGLSADVKAFVRYNANKAMMNLGFDSYFDEKDCEFSSIVLNGLDTKTKNSDFFSQKQNGYTKAVVTPLEDSDFVEILQLTQFN